MGGMLFISRGADSNWTLNPVGRSKVMLHEIRYVKALQKIQELKVAGQWSFRQPKKQRGPVVYKTHWDYLIEEMVWSYLFSPGVRPHISRWPGA